MHKLVYLSALKREKKIKTLVKIFAQEEITSNDYCTHQGTFQVIHATIFGVSSHYRSSKKEEQLHTVSPKKPMNLEIKIFSRRTKYILNQILLIGEVDSNHLNDHELE